MPAGQRRRVPQLRGVEWSISCPPANRRRGLRAVSLAYREGIHIFPHVADPAFFDFPYVGPMGTGGLTCGLHVHGEVSQNGYPVTLRNKLFRQKFNYILCFRNPAEKFGHTFTAVPSSCKRDVGIFGAIQATSSASKFRKEGMSPAAM
jgi:hypothetical protein